MPETSDKVKIGITNELRAKLWTEVYKAALATRPANVANSPEGTAAFAKTVADAAFGELELYSSGA